jgi:hypothetical protein
MDYFRAGFKMMTKRRGLYIRSTYIIIRTLSHSLNTAMDTDRFMRILFWSLSRAKELGRHESYSGDGAMLQAGRSRTPTR